MITQLQYHNIRSLLAHHLWFVIVRSSLIKHIRRAHDHGGPIGRLLARPSPTAPWSLALLRGNLAGGPRNGSLSKGLTLPLKVIQVVFQVLLSLDELTRGVTFQVDQSYLDPLLSLPQVVRQILNSHRVVFYNIIRCLLHFFWHEFFRLLDQLIYCFFVLTHLLFHLLYFVRVFGGKVLVFCLQTTAGFFHQVFHFSELFQVFLIIVCEFFRNCLIH